MFLSIFGAAVWCDSQCTQLLALCTGALIHRTGEVEDSLVELFRRLCHAFTAGVGKQRTKQCAGVVQTV